jgi:hypothetical protein
MVLLIGKTFQLQPCQRQSGEQRIIELEYKVKLLEKQRRAEHTERADAHHL